MNLRDRLRSGRRRPSAAVAALSRGDVAVVSCRLRRTSARGWGPWTPGTVSLGRVPGGEARWSTPDAVAVGFASTNEGVDLPFEEVSDVFLRSVRFRTEAFWGMQGDIVVVASERGTVELALPPAEVELVAVRLADLLLEGPA